MAHLVHIEKVSHPMEDRTSDRCISSTSLEGWTTDHLFNPKMGGFFFVGNTLLNMGWVFTCVCIYICTSSDIHLNIYNIYSDIHLYIYICMYTFTLHVCTYNICNMLVVLLYCPTTTPAIITGQL